MIARVACSKTLLHQFQVVPRALAVRAQEAAVDLRGALMPEKNGNGVTLATFSASFG